MLWAVFEIVKSVAASIIGSRLGQMAIVAVVAWFWSAYDTETKWRQIIATERAQLEALYKSELERQKTASAEIEADATKRDAEHAETVADMRATIEDYMNKLKEQPHVIVKDRIISDCSIDGGFTSVVRKLDSTRTRKPNSTAGARKLR